MNHTLSLSALATRAAGDRRAIDVVASTNAIDSYDEIVEQNWKLDRFRANPVVLYSHESHELPIGRAENVRVEDGKLLATLVLAKDSARADEVWSLVQQGMLRGVSVGFRPQTTRFEKRDGREVFVLDDNELIEISITPIPANPEALAQLRARAFGGKPAPTEKSMKTVLVALGLGAEADEATAVQAATQLRSLVAATGKSTPGEALGVIEGLKAKAARVDDLEAQIEATKAADAKRERDALLTEAKSYLPEGRESSWAYLRSAPLEGAKAFLDTLKADKQGVKTAPEAKQHTAPAPAQLTDREKSICHQIGVSEEEFAKNKAKRLAETPSED